MPGVNFEFIIINLIKIQAGFFSNYAAMNGNTRRTHRNAPAFKNPETNGAAEKSTDGKTEWNYWNKSGADEKKKWNY